MDNACLIPAAWMGLALVASLVSIRIGISVALSEIGLGVVAGNAFGLGTTEWIDFLAPFGAVLLTFLAGTESNPPRCAVTLGKAPPNLPLLRRRLDLGRRDSGRVRSRQAARGVGIAIATLTDVFDRRSPRPSCARSPVDTGLRPSGV